MKTLILFRLYDRSYSRNGEYGNKETLRVYLGDDNVLTYSLYGGWQHTGGGQAIGNLQLKKSLPMNPKNFTTTRKLVWEIEDVLKTGVGSHTVYESEVLNEISTKRTGGKPSQELIDRVMEGIRLDVDNEEIDALEELLRFCPKKNLIAYLPEDEWESFK